ncbi:hypothetical protein AEST_27800 [Alishewanella aestuarii B11]|uniref:Uncharacterized protein n=1 Tax=Alishewanella aestuarii B11 TaxID=1197174 RepID=J2IB78_9ALTE|nr:MULTISPECIES: hypothetical protein [Alishewanella]EJI84337.1 hypothetical protein AEST_27800 [Alishewanella aestuarii B11]MCT8125278.1 hypothetical protein [Alishewanella sp. BS5-314]
MKKFLILNTLVLFLLSFSVSSYASDERVIYNKHQSYTAVIEDVIDITDNGFRSLNYILTWNDNKIIVPANNLLVQKKKGEMLKFLVMWHELKTEEGSVKNLGFTALE